MFRTGRNGEENAVSPVVGVMLMLVVTIILAAIVSGFSGGLVGGTQKAPTLSMDIKIANTGSWQGSGFYATVTGVSEPIPTSKLKIVTSWSKYNASLNGTVIGGNVTIGSGKAVWDNATNPLMRSSVNAPIGYGPGVSGTSNLTTYTADQQFGNYTFMQGTGLIARPNGASTSAGDDWGTSSGSGYGVNSAYTYDASSDGNDAAIQVLGGGWEQLRAGDIVRVEIIHVPSGKVILSKEVSVTG